MGVIILGMDMQSLVNALMGMVAFLGGWMIKTSWTKQEELEDSIEDLRKHHESDLKEARQKINDLALSLPEKYVPRSDFDNLVKVVHHRFDRLEEKLDKMKK